MATRTDATLAGRIRAITGGAGGAAATTAVTASPARP
jgi:hypothetical protein